MGDNAIHNAAEILERLARYRPRVSLPHTHEARMRQQEEQQQQATATPPVPEAQVEPIMLSRLAESFYWIGRYIERAEATTRLLAEHHQLLVEDTRVLPTDGCRVLLDALSLGERRTESDQHATRFGPRGTRVTERPGTIAGSATAARENARAIRDALSGDVYEALNSVHLRLSAATASGVEPVSPGVLLNGVLERLAVVAGVLDWTSPRDETWVFMRLGRALERIDMTARLLKVRHDLLWPGKWASNCIASGRWASCVPAWASPVDRRSSPRVPRSRPDLPEVNARMCLRRGTGGSRT